MVARLREHPLAVVVGPSGVGKSSFVRAGVILALRASGDAFEVFIVRPGRSPLDALAEMLLPLGDASATRDRARLAARLRDEPGHVGVTLRARAAKRGEDIVLFVDQMEELYTLVPDPAERSAFAACITGVADDPSAPIRVLLSMRSDFLDRIGEDRRLLDEVLRGLVFLRPLGREALRQALEAPAAQLGYRFESPALVEEMVGSLEAAPGALPLLQFAAGKLWESRDVANRVLTAASYERMGGISGVLAQHADQVLASLPATSRPLVMELFRRLVTPDGTRAIVELSELDDLAADPREVRALVEQLAQSRLLVVQTRGDEGSATTELIHESLISSWPALRRWLDDRREDADFREQLRSAAKLWSARGQPQGLLWRDEEMQEARRWRARHADLLPEREQEFLTAVEKLATRAQRMRVAAMAGVIALLSLVIVGGAIVMAKIRRASELATERAEEAHVLTMRSQHAEALVTAQLDHIREEERARTEAESEIERRKLNLRVVSAELQRAQTQAASESRRAKDEAERNAALAESFHSSSARLEALLAEQKIQKEQILRERRKIAPALP